MGVTLRIGIDLGGTKIEAAAVDPEGRIRAKRRIATPAGDYGGTIAALAGLVAAIESEVGACASVGVGIPGTIVAETGLVKNANSTWLNRRTLGRDVEAALGRPVRFALPCRKRLTARLPAAAPCSGSFSAPGSAAAS